VWPRGIERISGRDGSVLYQREGTGPGLLVQPQHVYDMVDVMSGVIDYGTGKSAKLGRPAAGKTGTGQDYRDAWFVGFTAELVTGVWVGNDDNSPMKKVVGGSLPTQLWHAFMASALDGEPIRPLPLPDRTAQVATMIPGIDGEYPNPEAGPTRSDAPSGSLQDWLETIVTNKGSRK
jgi:penicillin-binding protein 1A